MVRNRRVGGGGAFDAVRFWSGVTPLPPALGAPPRSGGLGTPNPRPTPGDRRPGWTLSAIRACRGDQRGCRDELSVSAGPGHSPPGRCLRRLHRPIRVQAGRPPRTPAGPPLARLRRPVRHWAPARCVRGRESAPRWCSQFPPPGSSGGVEVGCMGPIRGLIVALPLVRGVRLRRRYDRGPFLFTSHPLFFPFHRGRGFRRFRICLRHFRRLIGRARNRSRPRRFPSWDPGASMPLVGLLRRWPRVPARDSQSPRPQSRPRPPRGRQRLRARPH